MDISEKCSAADLNKDKKVLHSEIFQWAPNYKNDEKKGDNNKASFCWIKSPIQKEQLGKDNIAIEGLIASLTFDGQNTNDNSGNDFHGELEGTKSFNLGFKGQGFQFNGESRKISIDHEKIPHFGHNTFSMAAWIKMDKFTGPRHIIGKRKLNNPGFVRIYSFENDIRLETNVGTVMTPNKYDDGQYHYIVGTRDENDKLTLYIDGIETNSQFLSGSFENQADFTIGRFFAGEKSFDGIIDEVKIFNKALTATEILDEYLKESGTIITEEPEPGLIASYDFREEGNSIMYDHSGNKHHGSIQGTTKRVQGKIGNALVFNGKDTFVKVPNHEDFNFGKGPFTMTAWVAVFLADPLPQHILGKRSVQEQNYFHIMRAEGNFLWGFSRGYTLPTSANTYDDGEWHFIAISRDASGKATFFLDGKDFSDQFPQDVSNSAPFTLGNREGTGEKFKGALDEIKVYNKALTLQELQQIYNSQK